MLQRINPRAVTGAHPTLTQAPAGPSGGQAKARYALSDVSSFTPASGTAPVTPAAAGPTFTTPVTSFDVATYLTSVGNPPTYRITQQQVDELRDLGMRHGVVGLPLGHGKDLEAQYAALGQELRLLNANGIRTDVYAYLHWKTGSRPRTDAEVRAEVTQQLDRLGSAPAQTFWLDAEFDASLNPSAGRAQNQRILDTAYRAFTDWKAAHPDSTLEFGIYTGKGAWYPNLSAGPQDPFDSKYAKLGVPLWQALYPAKRYDPADPAQAVSDMRAALGAGFGGWSVDAGNVRGWQYRAGEHDGHLPTWRVGLDRNLFLVDGSQADPPATATRSGARPGAPVVNTALESVLHGDAGLPVAQRKFQTMQDLINLVGAGKTTWKKLGVDENQAYRYRWEDPWKLVYGSPLG